MVSSVPQDIVVTKEDALYLPIRWEHDLTRGGGVLDSLSTDEGELKAILEPYYAQITGVLRARPRSPSTRHSPVTRTMNVADADTIDNNAHSDLQQQGSPPAKRRETSHGASAMADFSKD